MSAYELTKLLLAATMMEAHDVKKLLLAETMTAAHDVKDYYKTFSTAL
jgi:hypothetical protein